MTLQPRPPRAVGVGRQIGVYRWNLVCPGVPDARMRPLTTPATPA